MDAFDGKVNETRGHPWKEWVQQELEARQRAAVTVEGRIAQEERIKAYIRKEGDQKAGFLSFVWETVPHPILDEAAGASSEPIFVRLGATSAKDSFANGAPTTKPGPLPADATLILRRCLTSGRVAGRLLALDDSFWNEDPGEALIIQRCSPDIQLERQLRVFCYNGRDKVKIHLPFDTCTMDVLMSPPSQTEQWKAQVIEFNGFGAHLNTGSDLFHWVRDADALEGRSPGVTVRFVDDWEDNHSEQTAGVLLTEPSAIPATDVEPDWMVLEKQLQAKYADKAKDRKRVAMEQNAKLPLRGRWCSAY
ncbi:hypothetical protein QQS21_007194 [Conoideocrella luteorostrata]|uniref:Uncharacterized protein n=1 Tax=Conoideocrella luteorostrata TaxID=1105319 RepID=A0AAJ0FX97_9HYPO|nr:hypothetical protein QQS21_007194 [Conoideocrella luteorostrata]